VGKSKYVVVPGQRSGKLVTIRLEKRPHGGNDWFCKCDCGGTTYARTIDIALERKRGCRCVTREALIARNAANGVKAGDTYGQLFVLETYIVGTGKDSERYAICRCSCGKVKPIRGGDLRNESSQTCGHGVADASRARAEANGIKVGDKYGRWTVLATYVVGENPRLKRIGICRCECGRVRPVDGHNLRSEASQSCGCLQREALRDYFSKIGVQPGDKFGKLVVESIYWTGGTRSHRRAKCTCECGREKDVVAGSLVQGLTISCSCLGLERMKAGRRKYIQRLRVKRGFKSWQPLVGFNRAIWDICRVPFFQVKERDNYSCQLCGKRGGYLHTHHIVAKHQSLVPVVNPENLVTLCKACHLLAHDNHTWRDPNPTYAAILSECAIWAEEEQPCAYREEDYLVQVDELVSMYAAAKLPLAAPRRMN